MLEGESVKKNSVIEQNYKASIYKPLIDYFKKNLEKLSDFIICEPEIRKIVSKFSYDSFRKVFNNTRKFQNLVFCKDPHDPKIFHIINKDADIPAVYTKDVINSIAEKGYDSTKTKEIIKYWKNINNRADESIKNLSTIEFPKNNYQRQSENYSNLNMKNQSLDGT